MSNKDAYKLFCNQQAVDEEGIYCTAHLAEDRVFNCPYTIDTIEMAKKKCVDFEKKG